VTVRSAAQQQYFGLPRPLVDLVTAALATGEAEAISARVQAKAAARIAATRAAFAGTALRLRDGVPFAWLPMPRGWRASSYLRAAEAQGIRLKAADEFALIDGRAPNAVRLALTGETDDARFAEALGTLRGLLDRPPLEIDI
jgi:DNA-binding transcriptional MocR family regulator